MQLIEHDMTHAASLCDRLCGQIEEIARARRSVLSSCEDLMIAYGEAPHYVRSLLGARMARLRTAVEALAGPVNPRTETP